MSGTLVLLALLGAGGVFLIVDGILGLIPRRPATTGLKGALDIRGEAQPREQVSVLDDVPLLDRLVGPMLADLTRHVDPNKREKLAARLRRSGWKYKSVADYYATKVVLAAMFFLGGGIFLLISGMFGMFWLPFALGVLGYVMPDRELKSALEERKKRVFTEMAFSLDRLALLIKSGKAIQEALAMLAEAPGGVFTAALRRATRAIATGSLTPEKALAALEADLPEDPEIKQFTARIRLGLQGTPVAESLLVQAERMRAALNARLLKQGLQTVLVITTVGAAFMLPALAIIVLGPPLILAFRVF